MKVQYLQLKYFKLDVKAENLVGQILKEKKNWERLQKKNWGLYHPSNEGGTSPAKGSVKGIRAEGIWTECGDWTLTVQEVMLSGDSLICPWCSRNGFHGWATGASPIYPVERTLQLNVKRTFPTDHEEKVWKILGQFVEEPFKSTHGWQLITECLPKYKFFSTH